MNVTNKYSRALIGFMLICAGAATHAVERGVLNGVTYLSGGIGETEQEVIDQLEGYPYNLRLVFATTSTDEAGNTVYPYRADVHVWINRRLQGETAAPAWHFVSAGPFLYLELKPGEYEIRIDDVVTGDSRIVSVSATEATEVRFVSPTDMGLEQPTPGSSP